MALRKKTTKQNQTCHEHISELAYRLWEARGCPIGSPDVDWFLAERLTDEYRLDSPFDEFIREVTDALNRPSLTAGPRNDAEYARVIEERRYVIDVLDRVEMLAFAYSRLISLSAMHRSAEAQIDRTKRIISARPLTWEVPDEITWQRYSHELEARVLVAFVYYELTSLAHMIGAFKAKLPNGELQYLVKARDKFLAHPVFGERVRNAHGAMAIPKDGLLHAFAINAAEFDPILIDHYRSRFGVKTGAEEAHLREQNEQLILSRKRRSAFSADEQLRLKAFGIRKPDLEASLGEMAKVLRSLALP
jgi:Protein of unknown function (DUF2934)